MNEKQELSPGEISAVKDAIQSILSCGKEIILDELQKKLQEYRTQLYKADSVTQLNILNSGLMLDVDKLQKAGLEYIERSIGKFRGKV
jgi:hypothetical protein